MPHGDDEYASVMANQITEQKAGWRIVKALVDEDDEAFGFVISKGKRQKFIWVLMDHEGNGPGFLDIC